MSLTDLFQNKKLLIVVAHPDDELLGLGAAMNRLINEFNAKTHVVILGEGITSRSDKRDPDVWKKALAIHRQNIEDARACIGYHSVDPLDFPDNRFDSVPLLDLVKAVEKAKKQFEPDVIFTHHGGDLNIDHQKTFEAVMTAARPLEGESVKTVVTFETPSSTEWQSSEHPQLFRPNLYITVSDKNLQAKIDGMQKYQFEKREYPHPRSPQALQTIAARHGITVGHSFAEAFCLIRHLV